MTTKYNAENARENGITTVGDVSYGVTSLLNDLSRTDQLHRTSSGMHYRLRPGLASALGVEVVDPPGNHPTLPPTELVTVDSLATNLHSHVLSKSAVIEMLREDI